MLILHSNSYTFTLPRTSFVIPCVIAVSICVVVTDVAANAEADFRAETYFSPVADNGKVRLAKRNALDDISGNTLEHPPYRGDVANKEDLHGKSHLAPTSPGILHDDDADDVIGDDDRDEVGFDYDFALNLDKDADFDRLLSLLGRSGPAKHEGGHSKPGSTSTFIDRHDELIHADPDFNEEFPDAFLANPQKSGKKFDAGDGQSTVDHSEEDNKDNEQNRLEELYYKELERKHSSYEENDRLRRKKRLHNSAHVKASSPVIIFLAVIFLTCKEMS